MKKKLVQVAKGLIRPLVGRLNLEILERIESVVILNLKFPVTPETRKFSTREQLWEDIFKELKNKEITLLEFGVWQGYSLNSIAALNSNSKSTFIGFDSFEGLPDDWIAGFPKGHFSLGGIVPKIDDKRVKFIKGWFQNTLPDFLRKEPQMPNLVVHLDADLYSSTLFVLTQLDEIKRPYLAIFDEFWNHEIRALYDYQSAYNPGLELIAITGKQSRIVQAVFQVTPRIEHSFGR